MPNSAVISCFEDGWPYWDLALSLYQENLAESQESNQCFDYVYVEMQANKKMKLISFSAVDLCSQPRPYYRNEAISLDKTFLHMSDTTSVYFWCMEHAEEIYVPYVITL